MYNNSTYNVYEQTSGLFSQFENCNFSELFTESHTSEFDPADENGMVENVNGSTSTGSGCTGTSYIRIGSPSSPLNSNCSHPLNSTATFFQRSLSSNSLHKNGIYSPVTNPQMGVSNLGLGSVRRVSDLDQGVHMPRLHCHNGSALADETASIIIEGMTKPCRYSPTEKMERIERYRTKRSQRNFTKKIQYTCRKTLADSRPRVRGRFARNDELEKSDYSPDIKWTQYAGEEDEEDWIHLIDSISSHVL